MGSGFWLAQSGAMVDHRRPVKVVLVNPPSPPEFRVSRGLMGGFGMAVNPELLYPPIELAHVAALLELAHQVGDALLAPALELQERGGWSP